MLLSSSMPFLMKTWSPMKCKSGLRFKISKLASDEANGLWYKINNVRHIILNIRSII